MADAPLVALLAAGRATRFGGGKLTAPCAGQPLGRWAVDAAERAGLAPGLVVAGPDGAPFAPGWTVLVNPAPEQGLASSLVLAARHALDSAARTLLVLLADMPCVTPGHLETLAAAPAPAASRHPDGRAGVPALLDRALLERAATIAGDRGMGPLLAQVPLCDAPPGTLLDVDTPADLIAAERQLRAR